MFLTVIVAYEVRGPERPAKPCPVAQGVAYQIFIPRGMTPCCVFSRMIHTHGTASSSVTVAWDRGRGHHDVLARNRVLLLEILPAAPNPPPCIRQTLLRGRPAVGRVRATPPHTHGRGRGAYSHFIDAESVDSPDILESIPGSSPSQKPPTAQNARPPAYPHACLPGNARIAMQKRRNSPTPCDVHPGPSARRVYALPEQRHPPPRPPAASIRRQRSHGPSAVTPSRAQASGLTEDAAGCDYNRPPATTAAAAVPVLPAIPAVDTDHP